MPAFSARWAAMSLLLMGLPPAVATLAINRSPFDRRPLPRSRGASRKCDESRSNLPPITDVVRTSPFPHNVRPGHGTHAVVEKSTGKTGGFNGVTQKIPEFSGEFVTASRSNPRVL